MIKQRRQASLIKSLYFRKNIDTKCIICYKLKKLKFIERLVGCMKELQNTSNNTVKRVWECPRMEVLDISETMNGGQGIWQYVWDGEFWKLELLVS
ncbi:paeninodin family lasso peptide [Paenibacillus sp. 2KB_22]|uniref:paeninodin family lasso peptide n=1 Tax=Paenibacillus sp. 2KB_22 TaxID=3232978 RepID=UPI003F964038